MTGGRRNGSAADDRRPTAAPVVRVADLVDATATDVRAALAAAIGGDTLPDTVVSYVVDTPAGTLVTLELALTGRVGWRRRRALNQLTHGLTAVRARLESATGVGGDDAMTDHGGRAC